MIQVDFKLNPYGLNSNVVNIGNIYIANVADDPLVADYVYMIYEPKSKFSEEVFKHGMIIDHIRSQPFSKLLQSVMIDYGESACGLSQQYSDHWLKELGEDL